MKPRRVENLLTEVKIRFGNGWEECQLLDHALDTYQCLNNGKFDVELTENYGFNRNGQIFAFNNDNSYWATAKITEKPEMWVVEINKEHPKMEMFERWLEDNQILPISSSWSNHRYVGSAGSYSNNLLVYEGLQYITLDQWAGLFLNGPKEDSEFEQAVKPVIRYLLKNHNPHTKIMIDYNTAELLSGEAVVSLSDEVPDQRSKRGEIGA